MRCMLIPIVFAFPSAIAVNCGQHYAETCDHCVEDSDRHCNGDCKWLLTGVGQAQGFGRCVPNDWVSCGYLGKVAARCDECGGPTDCKGNCRWLHNQCIPALNENLNREFEKQPKSVSCGSHHAFSCSDCQMTKPATETDGCKGDCTWKGQPPQCMRTSSVQCGNHYAETCESCGNEASQCNGECQWDWHGIVCAKPGEHRAGEEVEHPHDRRRRTVEL